MRPLVPPSLRQPSLRDRVPVSLVEQRLAPVPDTRRPGRPGRMLVVEAYGGGLAVSGLEKAHDLPLVDPHGRRLALDRGQDLLGHHRRLVMGYGAALRNRDVGRVAERPDAVELLVPQ